MPTLDWIGKKAVVNHHRDVPYRMLKCDPALSVGEPGSGNLLVQGDNLLALKALLPYYAGQVKCIYIDPPYNTGNEGWIYNDNVNAPEVKKWLGQVVGREAEDLSRHDKWLCMMYPRLALLHQFLREDGVIFISIDDNAVGLLRVMMDEIFGTRNFIATICWQKKQSPQNDAANLSDMHDYVMVYAKRAKESRDDPNGWSRNLLPRTQEANDRYKNPDKDPRGAWTSGDYTCNKTRTERPNLYYPIRNPHTNEDVFPSERRVWIMEREATERNLRENRLWWGRDGKNMPRLKNFLSEVADGIVPSTWWTREDCGDNQEGRRELRSILPTGADFPTPKPTRLLRKILAIATDRDSIVLDSFAGSGATGHAVLGANAADNGNRRFILIEMDSVISAEITSRRIRTVIDAGIGAATQASPSSQNGGGGESGLPFPPPPKPATGFRYCTLADPLFDSSGHLCKSVTFADLARHVFFTETGEPLPTQPKKSSPLIGVCKHTAYYLLFNGILGDKRPDGGNVFTSKVLDALPKHVGPKVIFGEGCRLSPARLARESVTFRQIPYEIKVS